jgi:hypothetical protein
MSLTDPRELMLGKLRIWRTGTLGADPVVTLREASLYDPLRWSYAYGAYSQSGGENLLEYLPLDDQFGALVCRPSLVLQDTRLTGVTAWSTSGGSWEERRVGHDRKYRLIQNGAAADLQWSAVSAYTLPAFPSFAVSIKLYDTPSDHDATTYPPYVRLESGRVWALEWSKVNGSRLLRWNTATASWYAVMDLPEPDGAGTQDGEEALYYVRYVRGRIAVSADRGRSYLTYWDGTGALTPMSAQRLTLRGQGQKVVFGVHQLYMAAGTYTTIPTPIEAEARSAPDLSASRYTTVWAGQTMGAVSITDQGNPAAGQMRVRASLTPQAAGVGPGWTVYRSPEVYALAARYAPVSTSFLGVADEPFALLEATVEKPLELDAAEWTAAVRVDPDGEFEWQWGRLSKIELQLGASTADGDELPYSYVGHVVESAVDWPRHREVNLSLQMANVSQKWKLLRWDEGDRFPLGGRTLNQALDAILTTEGIPLNASYRVWDADGSGLGDAFVLPVGDAEDPFGLPRAGESKWETMQFLASLAGLELIPLDDGVLTTLPVDWYDPFTSKTLEAVPAAQLKNLLLRLGWRWRHRESATFVRVGGVMAGSGARLWAWALDADAERNPASARFTPFRIAIPDVIIPGTCTLGVVTALCQTYVRKYFLNKVSVEVGTIADLDVGRRQVHQVEGAEVAGVVASNRFGVMSLRHTYRPFLGETRTEQGMELLP